LEDTTVSLVVNRDNELSAYCTGVWIDKDVIMTAYHCVEVEFMAPDGEIITLDPVGLSVNYITFSDWNQRLKDDVVPVELARTARVWKADAKNDLAMIIVKKEDVPAHSSAWISREDIVAGDNVHVVGHTGGLWYTYLPGTISSIRKNIEHPNGNAPTILQVSTPAWFGNSGGGVFNDSGELIGICSFLTRRIPNVIFFIHRDHVLDLAKNNRLQ
jgi:S1-C subfamily serine protease